MDSVRFGRALGIGARQATKALVAAADAAAAPSPSAKAATPIRESTTQAHSKKTASSINQQAARTVTQVRQTREGLGRGSKGFGKAVWGPLAKLSGVLWLELSGVFFGLFLVPAIANVWRFRTNLHDTGTNHQQHLRLLWSVVMAAVFGYFCISSFVMAGRRQRRN